MSGACGGWDATSRTKSFPCASSAKKEEPKSRAGERLQVESGGGGVEDMRDGAEGESGEVEGGREGSGAKGQYEER